MPQNSVAKPQQKSTRLRNRSWGNGCSGRITPRPSSPSQTVVATPAPKNSVSGCPPIRGSLPQQKPRIPLVRRGNTKDQSACQLKNLTSPVSPGQRFQLRLHHRRWQVLLSGCVLPCERRFRSYHGQTRQITLGRPSLNFYLTRSFSEATFSTGSLRFAQTT